MMAAPATTAPTVLRAPMLAFSAVAEPAVVGTATAAEPAEVVAAAPEVKPAAEEALEVDTTEVVLATVELTKDLVVELMGVEETTATVELAMPVEVALAIPVWFLPRRAKVGSGIREHSPVQEVIVS